MRFGQEHIGALVQGRYSIVTQQRSRVLGPAYQAHDHEDSSEVFLKLFLRWPNTEELQANLQAWLTWGRFDRTPPQAPWGPCPIVHGQDDRGIFLVSPWAYGASSSEDWFPQGTPPVADVVALLISTLESLQSLHDQGLIHGSLRPSQVLLSENGPVVLLRPGLDLFVVPTLRRDVDRWALVRASRVHVWAPEVRAKIERASAPFPTEAADVFGFGRVVEAAIELLPSDLGTPKERLVEVAQECLQPVATDRPTIEEVVRQVEASIQRHRRPRASAPGAGDAQPDWSRMRGSSGRSKLIPAKPAPATSAIRRRMPSTDVRAEQSKGWPAGPEPEPHQPSPIAEPPPAVDEPPPAVDEPLADAAPPASEHEPANTVPVHPPPTSEEETEAPDLRQLWMEAETFAKYGLIKQAVTRAQRILHYDPTFEPAREMVERLAPPVDESLALSEEDIEEEPGEIINDFDDGDDFDQTILVPSVPDFTPEPVERVAACRVQG
ncbi:MAG: hypothetical protein AAFV29_08320 [Myxococcota bacterium]